MLVVGFRSKDYITKCLHSARRSAAGEDCEFLYIDCSNDGSEAVVRSELPWVRTFSFRGNLGFGGGNNFLASEAQGRQLLLLNPDVFANDNELAELIRLARTTPRGVAWGGTTIGRDGRADAVCGAPLPSLIRLGLCLLPESWRRRDADPRSPRRVGTLSGAFMMVDAEAWRSVGGFDEAFFLYSEEVDLCKRLRDRGGEIWFHQDIRILHDSGMGSRRTPSRFLNRARGDATYFRKHWTPLAAECGCLLLLARSVIRVALFAPLALARPRKHLIAFRAHLSVVTGYFSWRQGWQRRGLVESPD